MEDRLEIQKQVSYDISGLTRDERYDLEQDLMHGESIEWIMDRYGLNHTNERFDFITSYHVGEQRGEYV